jgi:enoyl-CoA hydratase
LVAALKASSGHPGGAATKIEAVLAGFAAEPEPASLAARQEPIDRCFAPETVEGILDGLASEAAGGGPHAEWAAQTRAALLAKSPISLKITLRQLVTGRDFDLDAALVLEYRLTQHVMEGHDFYEGVRAVVVDKDQMPHWRPASLAEVDDAMVNAYFAPIGARELRFE